MSKVQGQDAKVTSWKLGVGKYAVAISCFIAAILMARGLLYSYSRGAWLGTACGLAYLVGHRFWVLGSGGDYETSQVSNPSTLNPQLSTATPNCFHRNVLPLAAIVFCVGILFFWHFRQTNWHPARRAFSAINAGDYSWRNRVAAWEGALQIMADKPLFGFGWNQPDPLYEQYYLSPKLSESAAIEMNDYLMLGATLGIPALFCFGMYLWLSFFRDSAFSLQPLELLLATCRAGAIVLLVGFWFDGGLFKLATASTFWILLELGAVKLPQIGAKNANEVP
jgi:O-antigen ligase